MKNIAIFASGNGTNAERIIRYFENNDNVKISRVFCNNPGAYVLTRAGKLKVPVFVFDRKTFYETDEVANMLSAGKTDLIVLAGFLWLVPENILNRYEGRIINIHPALLPKYGGKGMYGAKVHKAVIDAGEKESGITVHYVNEKYDDGQIIFQAKVKIDPDETAESLATKIHKLEHIIYPEVIEGVLRVLESK